MNITKGPVQQAAIKVAIYGPEGIGKSTLAAAFPNPIFIDTEDSTKFMDVSRMDKPTSWPMLMEQVQYIRDNPSLCKTLVIDTADWAEQLCIRFVVSRGRVKSIEDYGYGKGYVMVAEEFGRLLNLLSEVTDRGINVVITAHAKMRKFEQPDDGSYDRWEMKLSRQVGPMVKEWSDMVLFANYKTIAVKSQGDTKSKGKGGRRVMYTTHNPCWDAKNRQGLADELPLEFSSIAHCVPASMPAPPAPAPVAPEPVAQDPAQKPDDDPWPAEATIEELNGDPPEDELPPGFKKAPDDIPVPFEQDTSVEAIYGRPFEPEVINANDPDHIKKILQLCNESQVYAEEICIVCERKGMVPKGTELRGYPDFFVNGNLLVNWEKIKAAILEFRKEVVDFRKERTS